jgi:hypothetical protein
VDNLRSIFMGVMAGAVLLMFGSGIIIAAHYSLGSEKPSDMPGIVSYFVSVANGPLAANLGLLLGINLARPHWRVPKTMTIVERFHWIAAAWYVAMLVVAIVCWGAAHFVDDPSKVVPLLPELTKNAIGIFIAVLAAVLGVDRAFGFASDGKEQGNNHT